MNKIIISDTSCLITLSRIGQLHILRRTFDYVYITQTVADEFQEALPEWIVIEQVHNLARLGQLKLMVDPGEASAIALALETENSVLIIDEKKGRKIAMSLNIPVIGTLKVLLIAKEKGAISSVRKLIVDLEKHSFRFHRSIVEEVLRLANELE